MDFFLLRVFPVLLGIGGLVFLPLEIRALARERAAGRPRYLKFGRRCLGAAVLFGLAVMVYLGEVPTSAEATAQTWSKFQHWLIVLGLTLFLMMLAVWDAIDGVKHLRTYLEDVEKEELQRIHEHLGQAGVGKGIHAPSGNGKPSHAPDTVA